MVLEIDLCSLRNFVVRFFQERFNDRAIMIPYRVVPHARCVCQDGLRQHALGAGRSGHHGIRSVDRGGGEDERVPGQSRGTRDGIENSSRPGLQGIDELFEIIRAM